LSRDSRLLRPPAATPLPSTTLFRSDDAELAELFVQLPDIRKWTEAIEQAALRRAYSEQRQLPGLKVVMSGGRRVVSDEAGLAARSEEHTSELQSRENLVCRLLLEKK